MNDQGRINPDWECTPLDVSDRIDAGENILLIDCRTDGEREIARIDDSLHIQHEALSANLETLFQKEDEYSELIVYCHFGVRSLGVVAALREAGFESVRSMAGGIDRWARDVDPSIATYS
ncbi:MAG: rhodanese-like domain-containing protein [Planctomycetota bacterium]|nr:rhodanese-like domain-containing protein [Planctomycetota bacterium]